MSDSVNQTDSAIFVAVGDSQYRPTDLAYGPWIPDTQHGSAMMGLIAHVAEQYPSDYPCHVTRLTVDLMKAAPMDVIDIEVKERSVSRNLNTLDILMWSNGKLYVQASALRIRVNSLPVPDSARHVKDLTLPEPFPDNYFDGHLNQKGFHHAVDLRFDDKTEPGVLWMRYTVPVVEGFPLSGFERAAMTADWTYATYNICRRVRALRMGKEYLPEFVSINLDNSMNLSRMPEGEWVGVQAQPHYDNFGSGVAAAWLVDEQGLCGSTSQSLLVRSPSDAPMHIKKRKQDAEE